MKRTVAEFFAGIGLMRLGLERVGWSVVWANDYDAGKRQMYVDNFGAEHLDPRSVWEVTAADLPDDLMLATASFPCTDLSLAGARAGLMCGEQSSAFWAFIDVLEQKGNRRPPIVLLENVTGFLTSHGGKDFEAAMMALNALGYAVDAFVLDAAWFVPQSRQRLFVVGMLQDPAQDGGIVATAASDLRRRALMSYAEAHPRIRWSMRLLDSPVRSGKRLPDVLDELPAEHFTWWDEKRATYLLGQMSMRHQQAAREMIAGEEYRYGTVFRRMRNGKSTAEMRTDGIAGCLRTPKGGSAKQILFRGGKEEYAARLLTPRECARLMGAGDDFVLPENGDKALFGFGDAVCADVVAWIGANYLNPLAAELAQAATLEKPAPIAATVAVAATPDLSPPIPLAA